MKFVLPFPVSVNSYYRSIPRGRVCQAILSERGRQYSRDAVAAIQSQGLSAPLTGRLAVHITLYPPDKRKRDLDNFGGKSLLDALTKAGVWIDDSQIDLLTIERGAIENRCEIAITEIDNAQRV